MSEESVKQIINGMVTEAPGFSDHEISERLEEQGVHISRRTVEKYRIKLDL